MSTTSTAAKRLWKEYKDLTHPKTGLKQVHVEIDEDNIFLWKVALLVLDPDSYYKGAYLKAQLRFPANYPFAPPQFKFTPAIYHPNVYNDGRLCISILHEGNDQNNPDEPLNECWSPVQSVESVLLSILSLLEDPNISSPANVDAAISWKKNKNDYKRRVENEVKRSRASIPDDFQFPELDDLVSKKEEEEHQEDKQEEEWWEDNYDDELDGYEEEEDDDDDDDDNEEESEEESDGDDDEDMLSSDNEEEVEVNGSTGNNKK